MAENIPMLALSPTMTDGTITAWKVAEGDVVKRGTVLCEVETDKAVMDYESPSAGILLKILTAAGSSAKVGDSIAVIGKAGEDASALPAALQSAAPQASAPAVVAAPAAVSAPAVVVAPAAVSVAVSALAPEAALPAAQAVSRRQDTSPAAAVNPAGFPRSSPLARALARDAGVDLRALRGSGPLGRVVKRDVEAVISGTAERQAASAGSSGGAAAPRTVRGREGGLVDKIVAASRTRMVVAKRLSDSMREAPHFFLRSAVEMDRLMALRASINAGRDEADRLSLNVFFVKLTASAIVRNPTINAAWKGDSIEFKRSVDIALAVALEDGLVAPVVRDCASKGLADIEREFRTLIAKAKEGRLQSSDYEGATFTISNLGAWGVEEFTAIINPPGSAILALGAVAREPVVRKDAGGAEAVAIRSMLRATLSCDHRVIDGAVGAAFMRDLKGLLEEPALALV